MASLEIRTNSEVLKMQFSPENSDAQEFAKKQMPSLDRKSIGLHTTDQVSHQFEVTTYAQE